MFFLIFILNKKKYFKFFYLIFIIIFFFISIGCKNVLPYVIPINMQNKICINSDYYLLASQKCNFKNKVNWQLLAIRALLYEGNYIKAYNELSLLPQDLNDLQLLEKNLLIFEIDFALKNNNFNKKKLNYFNNNFLLVNKCLNDNSKLITVNEDDDYLLLIRSYIKEESLLVDQARQNNLDLTWQTLLKLVSYDINNIIIDSNENILKGWLDLLKIYWDYKQDLALFKIKLESWKNRYPYHPVTKTLPTVLVNKFNFINNANLIIALFLPLSGQAKIFSDAIIQGFEAAKEDFLVKTSIPLTYETNIFNKIIQFSKNLNFNNIINTVLSPLDLANISKSTVDVLPFIDNIQLKIYDTTNQSLEFLLDQAQKDNVTLVIGPLLKENVNQLFNIKTSLKILALNQPEILNNNSNICYFSLSPEDEARDAVHHIWDQKKRKPLLLVPNGSFGIRIINSFYKEWIKLGGQTVLFQNIGSIDELRKIANNGSFKLKGIPISVLPNNMIESISSTFLTKEQEIFNNDIDSIYIIATSDQLIIIKSMIDSIISLHEKIAIYASSRSYTGGNDLDFRLEMEGLQFSDMPFFLDFKSEFFKKAMLNFKNNYSLIRLYAMGIDSWILSQQFIKFNYIPLISIKGVTGTLMTLPNCVISRKLFWLKYENGIIVPV